MKFQDSSFKGLKVTVGTKGFKVGGINEGARVVVFTSPEPKAHR